MYTQFYNYISNDSYLLKTIAIRNSLSDPYKARQTLERVNLGTLYCFKGGPSDLGTKILQKYYKILLILQKPFDFHS